MSRTLIAALVSAGALAAGPAGAWSPVVVELYTAQGCAACNGSAQFAAALADRPGVAQLTFNVDYWDYLGWKDTFALPESSKRQQAYDKRFGLKDVYTPQIVVGGAAQASADKTTQVDALIRKAWRGRDDGPEITPRADGTVAVGDADEDRRGRAKDVWLVRYDPRVQTVAIKAGDNRGETVSQRNVVRQLARLGTWRGGRRVFHLPPATEAGLSTLILVQGQDGGRILGAVRIRD